MGKIIGIDLGTTNSCVSVLENGSYKIIENLEGKRTTPSVVAYTDDGETLVGEPAQRQAVTNPEKTISAIKRLIGQRFENKDVQDFKSNAPFNIVSSDKGDAWVDIAGDKKAPSQVSAEILKKLKEAAESYLGEDVTEAVITVPAYFNDSQRKATINAGKIAGLDVKRIINEPTAAALAYGVDKNASDCDKTVIIYDLGGGTFDVSVLSITNEDGETAVEVVSTNGDTFLGGEDFDMRIVDYICDEFAKTNNGKDLREDPNALQRVKEAAENAKKELSCAQQTTINLPYVTIENGAPLHVDITMTRAKLEGLVEDLIQSTLAPIKNALKDANIDADDVDEILLVGGMTRMPAVQDLVKGHFNKEPSKGVNPDEVVSAGAAVQGGVLAGEIDTAILMDVTPLSLGLRVKDGVNSVLIPRNTTIPTKMTDVYSTAANNQPQVEVSVNQGERSMASDNKQLGVFHLDNIPPAPAGEPKIEVTFDIDANGVLKVSAKDQSTGREQSITIQADGGLSDAEIEAMMKEAEANKEQDQQRAEKVTLKNEAQAMINDLPNIQEQAYYKEAPEDAKKAFTDAIEELTAIVDTDDGDKLKASVTAASENLTKLGQAFTKAQKTESSNDNTDTPDADTTVENTKPAAKKADGPKK